ncbi:MAG TPA: Wzy polymerase domain-containing protein [Burkholderiaceae bacterium]
MKPNAVHPRAEPTGLGWVLWPAAVALPWLVPSHAAPWTTFHADAATAAALAALAAWALAQPGRWPLDRLGVGALALALIPLAQAMSGRLLYAGDGVMAAAFLAAVAAAVAIGRRCEALAPGRLPDALFAGLGVAAFGSTGLVLYQGLGLDALGVLVAPLPDGRRATANVGQPNLLATLQLWGLLALWWAWLRGQARSGVALAGAAFLVFALAATESRTGAVGALVLAAALVAFTDGRRARVALAAAAVLVVYLASLLIWTWPDSTMGGAPPLERIAIGRRPSIWLLMIDAITRGPAFGYGWNQGTLAQEAVAATHAPLGLVIQHAHNVVLDLMVWNGPWIGAAAAVALLAWFVVRWRAVRRPPEVVLLLVPTLLLWHAMVELPHVLLVLLLPAALATGVLLQRTGVTPPLRVPRPLCAVAVLLLVGYLGAVWLQYRAVEDDLRASLVRARRIGDLSPVPPPPTPLLAPLGDVLRAVRVVPQAGIDAATIDALERSARRYPSDGALFRLAQVAALNGRPELAAQSLQRLCRLYPQAACRAAHAAWKAQSENNDALRGVPLGAP